MSLVGYLGFRGYQGFYSKMAPKPLDFTGYADKPKTIVIVGAGIAGIMAAYYLADKHP